LLPAAPYPQADGGLIRLVVCMVSGRPESGIGDGSAFAEPEARSNDAEYAGPEEATILRTTALPPGQ